MIGASSLDSAAAVVVSVNIWSDPDLAQCCPQRCGGFGSLRACSAYLWEMAESQADRQAAGPLLEGSKGRGHAPAFDGAGALSTSASCISSISNNSRLCYHSLLAGAIAIMPRTRADPIVPSDQEVALAAAATRTLQQHRSGALAMRVQVAASGHEVATVDLPQAAAHLLTEMLKEMAAGNAVTLVPVEVELTTQQAADLLNVSRPYLVGLVSNGTLPARMVGNQRRLPLKDVLAYKAATRAKRREALRELAALDQELGLE
jgi:excisionase family DNA binding protein